jgi:hypothetical protein
MSGKYFILIENIDDEKSIFVTPQNKIKILGRDFFDEEFEGEEAIFFSNGLLTKSQINRYNSYKFDRKEEKSENFRLLIEDMAPWQRKKLLRQLESL